MSISDWSAATLCDHDDVIAEYSNARNLVSGADNDAKDVVIDAYCAKAKVDIGIKLDVALRGKLADDEYDADDLKDLISNPEVLLTAAVKLTLHKMFNNASVNDEDYNYIKSEYYRKKFTEDLSDALALIQFDNDESGDIAEGELYEGIPRYPLNRI